MRSVSRRLLLVWLLCIIAGTLAPYDFGAAQVRQAVFMYLRPALMSKTRCISHSTC